MQLFDNKYARLALLTLVISLSVWALIATLLMVLAIDVPLLLQLGLSVIASGLLVTKVFAGRVF